MKLFRVRSTIEKDAYGRLNVSWYVRSRPNQWDPIPYAFNSEFSAIEFIRECFTEEEAKQLQNYLKTVHSYECTMDEEELPAKEEFAPFCLIGEGGGHRVVRLYKEASYDLPFEVCGHYYLFEHTEESEIDPDFDIIIENGMVSTAGGAPIGMSDEDMPLKMILEHLMKKDKKSDEESEA